MSDIPPSPPPAGVWSMVTAIDRFFFGLCFGMGFAVANAVLAFIVAILSKGIH